MDKRLLQAGASPETLGLLRIVVCGVWLLKVGADPIGQFRFFPTEIFNPPGPLLLIPDSLWSILLSGTGLAALKAALILVLTLCALGVRGFRVWMILASVLLTYHQGLVRGFGFINHQELGALFCVWALVVFPSVDGLAIHRRQDARKDDAYGVALLTITFLMLVPYCAIAAFRLAFAAPEVFVGESMTWWLASLSGLDPDGWNWGREVVAYPLGRLAFKLGFVVVTVMELVSPLCLIWRWLRPIWLMIMMPFHVSCLFFMNIFFWENVILLPFLFFDFPALYRKWRKRD